MPTVTGRSDIPSVLPRPPFLSPGLSFEIEAQKEAEQKRRDNALLLSYTSEKEIDAARAREVQRVEGMITHAKACNRNTAAPTFRQ